MNIASRSGVYDESRWQTLCDKVRSGAKSFAIERNTFVPGHLFSAFHQTGKTQVSCWCWLDDRVMGTTLQLGYSLEDDRAVTPEEFRHWARAIAVASGMVPSSGGDLLQERLRLQQPESSLRDLLGDLVRRHSSIEEPAIPSMPTELSGIQITGWDQVAEEMEISLIPADDQDAVERVLLEAVARHWVEAGMEWGFHGWSPGDWDDGTYRFTADTGSQHVDWLTVLSDLAQRLAADSTTAAVRIRLGTSNLE